MKTTRDRAEDCVSYWNPSNFKGRSLIVDAVERSIKQAIDDARAAGYAEAIEKAAKLCDDRSKAHQAHVDAYEQLRDWESMGHQNAAAIASNSLRNAIRKLAPADKEKP